MKQKRILSLSAIAVAATVSVAPAVVLPKGDVASEWFKIDFNSYTVETAASANTEDAGAWSFTTADTSLVVADTEGTRGNFLDFAGSENLTFTPTANAETIVAQTVVEMDVYLHGSTTTPEVPDGSLTAIYLDTSAETPVLKGYQPSDKTWKPLSGVDIVDQSWVKLGVCTKSDYTADITVNGILVGNVKLGKDTTKIESVSFVGDGYLDNFSGSILEGFNFDVAQNEGTGSYEVVKSETGETNLKVTFNNILDNANTLRFVKLVQNGQSSIYRVNATDAGTWEKILAGLDTGSITAYYGDNVSAIPAEYKPEIKPAVIDGKEQPAISVDKETKKVNFVIANAIPGVYYKVVKIASDGTTSEETPVLLSNVDENDEPIFGEVATTFTIDAAPEEWGVVKVRFVASDDAK